MSKKSLLTTEQMKARFPAQWLLITDYKLDALTSLRKGRVVAHSKDRGEIHRALKQYPGNLCIHFTGSPPPETEVIFTANIQ